MNLQEAKAYAAAHVHQRPDSAGRLGGKLAVVTGAAQGFGLGSPKSWPWRGHGW